MLYSTLKSCNVDTTNCCFVNYNTMLAFLSISSRKESSYTFYCSDTANNHLSVLHANINPVGNILHFGTLSLVQPNNRRIHDSLIKLIKRHNGIISFDPNIRLSFWKNEKYLRKLTWRYFQVADIIKVSLEELYWITEEVNFEIALKKLQKINPKVLFITKGAEGATVYVDNKQINVASPSITAIDTTGAGDAFVGSVLAQLSKEENIDSLLPSQWEEITKNAVVFATETVKYSGAIPSYIKVLTIE